ncbi:MAG TPA: FAD-dependent oxidoreductase, partial [Trueperaceae bacterium]|nr:FAD-dependent oxidoreductase [Trueperaceae bacterium]
PSSSAARPRALHRREVGSRLPESNLRTEIAVIGGGLGGVAAALAALKLGCSVVLTEETEWLGGQLTAQAVPPDEHPWIDHLGSTGSYREFRRRVRDYYRRNYPLLSEVRDQSRFNPGMGFVSELCAEPRAAVACLEEMLAPFRATGRLQVRMQCAPISVVQDGDRFSAVELRDGRSGETFFVEAEYVLDATELGDLLVLGGVEHVVGAEGQSDTGEPHALEVADPLNQQSHSWCFALSHHPGEDHTIAKPDDYEFWRAHHIPDWPETQLSWTVVHPITLEAQTRPLFVGDSDAPILNDLWHFRRILYRRYYPAGFYSSDVTVANWPQLDYTLGPLTGVTQEEAQRSRDGARALSLAMVHWMQTEAPRPDGGNGYPGLKLRGDVTGTSDGLAMYPYVRESRRIKAEFTVLEQHVSKDARAGLDGAEQFADSVGTGSYRIDLHPSTRGRNFVDISTYPFQVPLGALLPIRLQNLLPAAKNIGTTHVTNGCYRLHPVEWNVGEVAGALAAFSLTRGLEARRVRTDRVLLSEFQDLLVSRFDVPLTWPDEIRRLPRDLPFGTSDAYGRSGLEHD